MILIVSMMIIMIKNSKKNNECIDNVVFFDNEQKIKRKISLFSIGIMLFFFIGQIFALAAPISHPSLLFNDIMQTPGYQHRSENPWNSWEKAIVASADSSLSRNFYNSNWSTYDRISYRASFAETLALAFQITKKTAYAEKAKEALLNLEVGTSIYNQDKALALSDYSLAYDWVQIYLDPANETIIRDKLASLANTVYKNLNADGTNLNYIAFADDHGQAYPVMGIAGIALQDYTNPNKIPLTSTPSDWLKVGTEYLFVNDKLHNYNRSLFSFGFDDSGKHLSGAYKAYIIDDYVRWFQVYSNFYGKNIFDEYPVAKLAFTSEIWESMPNYYNNNYVTSGNTKQYYFKVLLNLLDNENKSYALKHIDSIEKNNLLLYSSGTDYMTNDMLYLLYNNYSLFPRKDPIKTSYLSYNSIYQVFRGSWATDSEWLSLITWNVISTSNRDMAHHDQMSFEYYGKGDLLLADAGEHKHVLDQVDYSETEVYHNTVAFEDPRVPFPLSSWANSSARGFFKGDSSNLITPVNIQNLIQVPWMQLINTNAKINYVIGTSWSVKKSLSSPIQYRRDILFPNEEYFIITDRFEGKEPWIYRNVFRPTSLNITPSLGINENDVGHVNEELYIGNTQYDWLSLPYKTEISTGINTNSIKWKTVNPYGNNVEMHLFSVPSSEIKITKNIGRIAGYDTKSEVYNPIIYFRNEPMKELNRITILLSRYSNETEKTPQEISVNGSGNAVKIKSSAYEDYIYSGIGKSSFDKFSTDAELLYVRKTTKPSEYTMINGTYLNYSGQPIMSLSKKIDYFTLREEKNKIFFKLKGSGKVNITLYNITSDFKEINKDGTKYTSWVMNNNNLELTTDLTEHDFELISTSNISGSKLDMNLDGKIDILDLIFSSQFFGLNSKYPYPVYDVNNDGQVNVLDLALIGKDIT